MWGDCSVTPVVGDIPVVAGLARAAQCLSAHSIALGAPTVRRRNCRVCGVIAGGAHNRGELDYSQQVVGRAQLMRRFVATAQTRQIWSLCC